MYKFIDTTEVSGSALLPSEALQINGEYIENLIPGYRTLNVSGREALSPEIGTFETGVRDGATRKSKRFPARTIIVKYQLIAESNEAFREAYNQLAGVLNVEDAELIFNDEPDKFFTGTPSAIGEVEPGMNAVVGEFEILCVDPFKYSVTEYEVEPSITEDTDEDGNVIAAKTFVVDYKGTYKSYPTFEADFYSENETSKDGETEVPLTGDGDCGFVSYFNESGKIIQLGSPEELDGESFPKSQTLVNQSFKSSTAWGSAAQKLWKLNVGKITSDNIIHSGTMKIGETGGVYCLKPNYDPAGPNFHGPSITRTIPADASGAVGAKDFTLTYKQKMAIGSNANRGPEQLGLFEALLVNGSGDSRKVVAGVRITKSIEGSRNAALRFFVNGKAVHSMTIDLSYHNKHFGNNRKEDKKKGIKAIKTVKTSTIKKTGNKVKFNIGGIKKTFNCSDSSFASLAATEVTFVFCRHRRMYLPLSFNFIYSAKLVKNNCTSWREVPNKFSTDDVLIADCRTGEVLFNDTLSPEYGSLGNDWEEFYLKPGTNQIGVAYSDWVSDDFAPTFKMRYREVFL